MLLRSQENAESDPGGIHCVSNKTEKTPKIMYIMGHSDVQTTMNIYNVIQKAKKKESFEALNSKIKIS